MKTTFTLLFLLMLNSNAIAGYQVSNYVGSIGNYPIHISIQETDYGRTSGITLLGSYYYDKNMSPIPIYGKHTNRDSIEMCEIHNDVELQNIILKGSNVAIDTKTCPFRLTMNAGDAYGTWKNGASVLNVTLRLIGEIKNPDTEAHPFKGIAEIPYWGQTKNHMFIGVYEENAESERWIKKIKVIDKRTKTVTQEINPKDNDCFFGTYMTLIYMNIEARGTNKYEGILLNCYGPRDATLSFYTFDKKQINFVFLHKI